LGPQLSPPVGRPPRSGLQVKIVALHYQGRIWSWPRRGLAKIEGPRGELFPRLGFAVPNSRLPAGKVIKVYNGRGEVENRIKEGKNTVCWDKTSCPRFEANQARLRLKLGVLAGNLLHMLRQFWVWGEEVKRSLDWLSKGLIKGGARVSRPAVACACGLSFSPGAPSSSRVHGPMECQESRNQGVFARENCTKITPVSFYTFI
jgi:hypothetical protein